MNDSGDNYDRMPIDRVDLILGHLWPEYWTPERLRGASLSDKREALRQAFTGRGRRGVRAGKNSRPAHRAATDPVSKPVSSEDAQPAKGLILGGERTIQLNATLTEGGGYDYGDLDPRV